MSTTDPLDGLAERLAATVSRRRPVAGATRVLAVDGPSGSGKTLVADAIAERLTGNVQTLRIDDIVPGWHGLSRVPRLLGEALGDLAAGRPASLRLWDWSASRPGGRFEIDRPDVLILDGCASGSRAVRVFVSLLVWVEAPAETRRTRALHRDGDVYRPWWDVWAAQERDVFAREGTRGAADIVIRTG